MPIHFVIHKTRGVVGAGVTPSSALQDAKHSHDNQLDKSQLKVYNSKNHIETYQKYKAEIYKKVYSYRGIPL